MGSMHGDEFDFWLGRWEVHWGEGARGANTVRRVLGGKVILEEFDGRPGTELEGMSVSVYHPEGDVWRQTWVDSQGNYLDFVGSFQNGVMDLRRETPEGIFRMRWFEIGPDSLWWR